MAQLVREFNRYCLCVDGVLKNVNLPMRIDEGDIEPGERIQPRTCLRQEFGRGVDQSGDLTRGDPFRGTGMSSAFLNFDKNKPVFILEDEINFTTLSSPTLTVQNHPTIFIDPGDLLFGCQARKIG